MANVTPKHDTGGKEGRIGIALLVLNLGFTWGCVVNTKPRPLFPSKVAPFLTVEFIYVSRYNKQPRQI
jgi:hypothetical protein